MKSEDVRGEAALGLQPHAKDRPLDFLELGDGARLKGTHDWTLLELQVPAFPPDAVRMYGYLWVKGSGTAWFDEFSLSDQGVQVPLGAVFVRKWEAGEDVYAYEFARGDRSLLMLWSEGSHEA